MDCKEALLEMGRWRESLNEMLVVVESIKRNIEHGGWDERMSNLLNYIEQLDREATIESEVLKEMQTQGGDASVDISRDRFRKRLFSSCLQRTPKKSTLKDTKKSFPLLPGMS